MNDDRVDWSNALRSNQMFYNIPLKRWFFVYPDRCTRESEEFYRAMQQVANGMHYDVADPKVEVLRDDRTATYVRTLEELVKKDPKMIVIVVPNNAADRYAAIKRLTCVEKTIPTQVIVHKTMTPKKGGVLSIATKVMIQINCKLGGAPWMINFPLKGTMTVGFDVNHDTRDKSLSFGAFIATMDLKKKVEFFSGATTHKNGEEMAGNIEVHMVKALKKFKDTHGALPERILFYRDGVGEGQLAYVHEQVTSERIHW
jgi:aubergine-like protein